MKTAMRFFRAALLAMGLTGTAAPAAAQLVYTGSLEAANGDYIFTDRTTSFALSNGLLMRSGRFYGNLSLPLVLQNSSAVSYIAGVPVPTGGPEHGKVKDQRGGGRGGQGGQGSRSAVFPVGFSLVADSGDVVDIAPPGDFKAHVGDPRLSVGIDLLEGTGLLRSVSVEGHSKAPLASLESGVGSGEWDFGVGANLVLGSGGTFFFADLAWWQLGDLPDLELKDPFQYGLAVGRTFRDGTWSMLASWSGSTRMIDGVDAEQSIGLAGSYSLGPGRSLSAGLSKGLTESGSDIAAFLGWSVTIRN